MQSVRNNTRRGRVLARFEIGERPLLVVERAERSEASAAADLPAAELARFVIDGAAYALVREDLGGASPDGEPGVALAPARVLTARELQIAALVAEGLLNKEVADRLRISEWTVCAHLRRIYSKLGVSTRGAMVYQCASLVRARAREQPD